MSISFHPIKRIIKSFAKTIRFGTLSPKNLNFKLNPFKA